MQWTADVWPQEQSWKVSETTKNQSRRRKIKSQVCSGKEVAGIRPLGRRDGRATVSSGGVTSEGRGSIESGMFLRK